MDHTDTELGTNPQKVNSNTEAEAVFAIELSRAPPSHVSTGSVDGSRRAWVQVLGCFVMFFNIWGYPSVWGSFQEYYSSQLLSHYSSASIAWIGSTQSTLLIVVGILSGPIFDLGYYRALIFSGAIICVIGAILVSFATKYWHVFLCQGLCVGFGCGLLFIPTLALVTRSFKRAREFAVAIVFCGTPIGESDRRGCYWNEKLNLISRCHFIWARLLEADRSFRISLNSAGYGIHHDGYIRHSLATCSLGRIQYRPDC